MSAALSNQLVQNQQMTLTPKMVEELKMLQMSNIELLQYIDVQLNENPLLVLEDNDPVDPEQPDNEINKDDIDDFDYEEQLQKKDFTEYSSRPITLRQHLLLQIGELCINLETRKIAVYLIETINDDGYLGTSIGDTSHILGVSIEKVKKALKIVQKLEPAGVGARNLKECILLQLNQRALFSNIIKTIVTDYLELLAVKKYRTISEKLCLTLEKVAEIHQIIRSTDPKPGAKFCDNAPAGYIQPELFVKLIDEKFVVLFNNDSILNLKVSEFYRKLIKSEESTNDAKKYIKSKISKAMEIINAVEQRKRTVLNVASYIIEYQEEFLRKGHMFLRPLTLKMAADNIGLHESTISRTVNEKYIETPKGVFELKFFFSTQIDTASEVGIAANAVKKAIKDIVQNEDKKNPLSDERIRKILGEINIRIARRTVTKYRCNLKIPTVNFRKVI